ncbi:MAG: plasmid pRiA4b ORF-3 family protein [Prevotellaceae bacterium]|jgi:hypothetical protein|nr:plasmid pRiA4b ORF-3 family protein [Prevotellaceae bacterium]
MLQFKIQIKGLKNPTVWRRILVPETLTFDEFHRIIQRVFGWENAHLYQFSELGYKSREVISVPNYLMGGEIDSTKVKLNKIFKTKGQKYVYIYDFGDDWIHDIKLEKITDETGLKPSCIDGEGACPPEDCGGVWGYEDLKQLFAENPESDEADEMREWLGFEDGETWDAGYFDVSGANFWFR